MFFHCTLIHINTDALLGSNIFNLSNHPKVKLPTLESNSASAASKLTNAICPPFVENARQRNLVTWMVCTPSTYSTDTICDICAYKLPTLCKVSSETNFFLRAKPSGLSQLRVRCSIHAQVHPALCKGLYFSHAASVRYIAMAWSIPCPVRSSQCTSYLFPAVSSIWK
jgi:hypothetical protein